MIIIEKIKCFLRANKYYKKYCQTRVNDCRYWCRGLKYYRKLYNWKLDKLIDENTIYFIIDPNISHPGLADRFKAIIGTYYIAQQNGFDFKIIFNHPFTLSTYLSSDNYGSIDDLSYSLKNSRILAYNGGGKVPRLNKSIKQYHVYNYIGYDILETNNIDNYQQLWGELFRSLFKPTALLETALANISNIDESYIAIHLRFVNALEQFEENHFNYLSDDEKEALINKCLDGIEMIRTKYSNKSIIVFSDSSIFLNRVKLQLDVLVLDGEIGHISFNSTNDAALKTFIDYFVMSKADLVIRILTKEIYATVFSYYAALSGGKKCIDYRI